MNSCKAICQALCFLTGYKCRHNDVTWARGRRGEGEGEGEGEVEGEALLFHFMKAIGAVEL